MRNNNIKCELFDVKNRIWWKASFTKLGKVIRWPFHERSYCQT